MRNYLSDNEKMKEESVNQKDNTAKNKMHSIRTSDMKNLRGVFAAYSDPALRVKEKNAWERAAIKRFQDIYKHCVD